VVLAEGALFVLGMAACGVRRLLMLLSICALSHSKKVACRSGRNPEQVRDPRDLGGNRERRDGIARRGRGGRDNFDWVNNVTLGIYFGATSRCSRKRRCDITLSPTLNQQQTGVGRNAGRWNTWGRGDCVALAAVSGLPEWTGGSDLPVPSLGGTE